VKVKGKKEEITCPMCEGEKTDPEPFFKRETVVIGGMPHKNLCLPNLVLKHANIELDPRYGFRWFDLGWYEHDTRVWHLGPEMTTATIEALATYAPPPGQDDLPF